jgi:glycine hydroxymethyltransferase
MDRGVDVVSGGTDTPVVLVDLRRRGMTGDVASDVLEMAGLTANKNAVPGDTRPPTVTSGLRFGSSAGTARGFGSTEFTRIGHLIADVLQSADGGQSDGAVEATRVEVRAMCRSFPIYP